MLRRRTLLAASALAGAGYLSAAAYYYLAQESLLFFPTRLPAEHRFEFAAPFEEHRIAMADGVRLHTLLFPASPSRGVVLYLHGNGGALDAWGAHAREFLALGFDFFVVDYRGYGKSEGEIDSEQQLLADAARLYDWLAERYAEERIVVAGNSIGTGIAAQLACSRSPRRLLLLAPYDNLLTLARHHVTFLRLAPAALLRYRLPTDETLADCATPVTIVHGDRDEIIPIAAAERLATRLKPGDELIRLAGGGHVLRRHPGYAEALRHALEAPLAAASGQP